MKSCLLWDFDNTLAYRREGGFRSGLSETLDENMPGHGIEPDDLRNPLRDGFPWHEWNRPHLELSSPDLWWDHVEKKTFYNRSQAIEVALQEKLARLEKSRLAREAAKLDPAKERSWYSMYEPIRNVTPAYPPTMLLHGELDTDVPFEQSVLMAEALNRQGVEREFVTSPDWGHGFDGAGIDDRAVQEAFAQVLEFLAKYV